MKTMDTFAIFALETCSIGTRPSWPQSKVHAGKMPALPEAEPKGWHSRGYLPHFDGGKIPQAITFRLSDSLPRERLDAWEKELHDLPAQKSEVKLRRRIEAYLDAGHGEALLAKPHVATIVENALLYFDSKRYRLHGWVVMPNHVHVLITLLDGHSLSDIIHSWKSFTANKANHALGRVGPFWQSEYFDRYIRDERHFASELFYIENNPVRAGLCQRQEEWLYSSAAKQRLP